MYAVIETQTTAGVMTALPTVVKASRDEAEQEYHSKLAFAAVSTVEIHAVSILNAEGQKIKGECYKHGQAAV